MSANTGECNLSHLVRYFARLKREEWLFAVGLATIVTTFLVSAVSNPTSFVWLAFVISLLTLLNFLGFAVISGRSEERLQSVLNASLPETQFIDDYSYLSEELLNAVRNAEKFIFCTGSEGRNEKYLLEISEKAKSGVQYKRILYPDRLHDNLVSHLGELITAESTSILATEERNLPHLLITESTTLIVIPQPKKGNPVAFRLNRPDKVIFLQAYFAGLSGMAVPIDDQNDLKQFNSSLTPLSEKLTPG